MIRALVAKADGIPARDGKAFASGSLTGGSVVPVLREWDYERQCGTARLELQGADLYVDITLNDGLSEHGATGLFPALGEKALGFTETERQVQTYGQLGDPLVIFCHFDVVCVSLNVAPNIDERIPPIGGWTL